MTAFGDGVLNPKRAAVRGLRQCRLTGQSNCTESHVSDLRRLKQTLLTVLCYFVSSPSLFNPFNVIFAQRANINLRLFM